MFYYYAITVVPIFPSFPPSIQPQQPTPSGNPHTVVHVHGSYIYVLWQLYFLCYTLHHNDYSVTTNLHFSVLSPFPPSPQPVSPLAIVWKMVTLKDWNMWDGLSGNEEKRGSILARNTMALFQDSLRKNRCNKEKQTNKKKHKKKFKGKERIGDRRRKDGKALLLASFTFMAMISATQPPPLNVGR